VIRYLMFRDRAVWLGLLVGLWALLIAVSFRPSDAADDGGIMSTSILSTVAFPWVAGLSALRPRRRASEIDVSLPIAGRTLAAARMAALAVYCLTPVAVILLMAALTRTLIAASLSTANLGAAMLVWLFLVQSRSRGKSEVPSGAAYTGLAALGIATGTAVSFAPTATPALALLAVAGVLFVLAYRLTPPALEIVPSATTAGSAGSTAAPRARRSAHALLFRGLDWGWLVLAAGVAAANTGMGASRWPSLVFLPIMGAATLARMQASYSWLDPLPVSRRRLAAYACLPLLAAIGIGIVAGNSLRPPATMAAVGFEFECFYPLGTRIGDAACARQVQVPVEHWRLAWSGVPPAISLASGETVRPAARPLFWGLPTAAYNPYAVEERSSPAMVAHQLSRAIEAAHGATVPAADIARRYLRVDSRGLVAITGDGFTYADDYALSAPAEGTDGAVLLLLCALVWFASAAAGARAGLGHGMSPLRRWRIWMVFAAFVLFLSILVALDSKVIEWLLTEIFVAARRTLPGAPVAAWTVTLAVIGLLFVAIRPLFEAAELSPTATTPRQNAARTIGLVVMAVGMLAAAGVILETDVHHNASAGRTFALRFQLLLGRNIEALDGGRTPLLEAASSGESTTVRLLLDRGARVEAKDERGRTALHIAMESDRVTNRPGTIRALLDHGADPNGRGPHGRTPLMEAVHYERARVIELLVSRGADLEARDAGGRTALDIAAAEKRTECERVLRELLAR